MSAKNKPGLNALRAFEVVARQGSLERAAEELSVTASAIGHQVRGLEEWFGVRLFEGDGRARTLSPKGKRLAAALHDAFDRIDIACGEVRSADAADLHVNVTPTFAIRWLVPRLGRFQAAHPEIAINIRTSGAPLDAASDVIHTAVRFGRPPWPGLISELVFLEDIFPVCSPKLLPQGPAPADPRAIRGHTLIHSSHRLGDWPRWLKAAGLGEREIDPSRGLVFDLTTMALDAAEAGLGIAITRQAQVAAALEAGTLIAPFRRDLLSGEGCYLLTRPERADDPGVQAFRRWLMEEARACAAEWRRGRGGSALAGPEARAARPRSQRPGQRPGVA